MKKFSVISLLIIVLGVVMVFVYPYYHIRKQAQQQLDTLTAAVATQKTEEVQRALGAMLKDDAQVQLDVTFFAAPGQQAPAIRQSFDKAGFLRFIDVTMYSVTGSSFTAHVESAAPIMDSAEILAVFRAEAAGVSPSGMLPGATLKMTADSQCEAVLAMKEGALQARNVTCAVWMR